MSDATTHERLAAWLDGEAALYRERAQRAEDAQDWDPAVRYAGAADALVQLRDRVLLGEQIGPPPGQNGGLAAIFGRWPGDETDEEIRHGGGEMSGSYYDVLALESRAYDIAHWIAMEARVAESLDRSVAPIESEGARRIVALASARPTPTDVREPTDAQINVWSIIRSALSRAWALSRPWAVADRPQVTSEVVARLDAIAADCEREVLTALRPEAQGEGATTHLIRTAVAVADAAPWRQSPDMDLLKSAVEEYRAARRGEGGA